MPRILVVDDEELVRFTLRVELAEAGHEVVEAVDGADAVAKADEAGPFDLVITDLVMPRQEGFETIAHFRTNHPDVKVIAISGWQQDDAAARLAGGGASAADVDGYLKKPFTGGQLLDEIGRVMAA